MFVPRPLQNRGCGEGRRRGRGVTRGRRSGKGEGSGKGGREGDIKLRGHRCHYSDRSAIDVGGGRTSHGALVLMIDAGGGLGAGMGDEFLFNLPRFAVLIFAVYFVAIISFSIPWR